MKWFFKKITALAIINFIFLLSFVSFVPLQKREELQEITGSISSAKSVKDFFSELGKHNTKNDCWIGYRGRVYDITPVFGTHPGGDGTMIGYCGSDATKGFDTKDMNPPMPHSANAINLLAQYLIQ